LQLERLETRLNMAPIAAVSGLSNASPLLGENVSYSFTFANTDAVDTGYSPFFDLIVDTSGPDGTTNLPATSVNPTTPGTAADGFVGTSGATVPTVGVSGLALQPLGTPIVLTLGQTTYVNPYTGQTLGVPAGYGAGDTIYTYQLPFGSFTPGQNTLVSVSLPTSRLADVGTPLNLTVRPGFRDTDGDPNTPFVPTPAGTHLDSNASATPRLYSLTKTYLGPENETATGPNFVRRYRVDVDIATGQTINTLQLTDDLGPTMQLAGLTSANMGAYLASSGLTTNIFNPVNRTGTATATAPDGTVTYAFGNVTGVDGTDAAFEFDFFVPRDTSAGTETLPQPTPPGPNPAGGTDSIFDTNTASSVGTWNPIDSRDPQNQNVAKAAPDNGPHTLEEHSVAVQKSVRIVTIASPNTATGGTVIPGQSLLRYTVNFQISDYYAVNNLFLEDVLGDGQRLYLAPGFTPTLSVQNPYTFASGGTRAATSTGVFAGANTIDYQRRYTVTGDTDSDPSVGVEGYAATGPSGGPFSAPSSGAIDGSTFLRFNISAELVSRGLSGILVGGEIADGGGNPQNLRTPPFGPAQGTITFWAIAKQEYADNFPSGDNSVDQGDTLTNSVPLIQGNHLNPNDLSDGTPTALGTVGTDDSGTSVTIDSGEQTKTVYAINSTIVPTQTVADTVFSVQAGDRLTYKLTYTLPISRFEDLRILDIPPLPVMQVGAAGLYAFDSTFDGSLNPYEIEVAPDDTFFSTFGAPAPTITTDPITNTLQLDFGDFDDPLSRPTTISLLVTFPVSGDTFASDLFLTNQLRVIEGNTFLGSTTLEDLRRIQLVRPAVTIDKGIVGFGNTGRTLGGIAFVAPNAGAPNFTGTLDTATEADGVGAANLATSDNADAADVVRYAIVAQNTGRGDAYDVIIEDQVQPGYAIPGSFAGLNLNIRRGDGTLLSNFAQVQAFARVATTAGLTGSGLAFSVTGGGQFTNVDRTLDAVTLNLNELVLVKNQATASQNGVYRVTAVNVATNRVTLTRDVAFDTAPELATSFVAVMGGTSANRYFQAGAVATLNTDAVNYTLQATTQDYYAIYDSTTGAFRLLLSDNYSAGNVNFVGEVPDDRSGSLSRRESTPLVSGVSNPPVTLITNGSNTVVVQYDLTLASNVAPNQTIINTAAITNIGTGEGGINTTDPTLVPGATPITDIATAIVRLPSNTKTLVGTEITEPGNAASNQAVIGELVTYDVVLTIPEGITPGANVFDRLDHGLAFSSIESVTLSSAALSTSSGITFANNGATNATTLAGGTTFSGTNNRDITFTLGAITNTNTDNSVAETITIRYRVVVLNSNSLTGDADGNQSGDQRNNSAQIRWTNNASTVAAVSAANVTIREPQLTTTKDVAVQPAGVGPYGAFAQAVRADAGDNVRYRITIANGLATTSTTAFDVTLSDPLPTANFFGGAAAFSVATVTTTGAGSVRRDGVGHALTAADFEITVGGLLRFNPAFRYDIEPSVSVAVTVQGTNFLGATGQLVSNVADVRWTSLPQDPGNRAGNGQLIGVERTGANGEGSGLNNYADADDAVIESPIVVRKSLVSTSETSTSAANVAVGEIARFRLVASVPEGATANFQIQDILPAGLAFLNDGTARFAFVSTGGNVISSAGITNVTGLGTPTIGTGGIDGNEATLATLLSSNITGTFNDNNVAPGSTGVGTGDASVYTDGADVFFRFGDVSNTDNDVDFEYVVIEFNALTLNVVGNQAGTSLANRMTALADTDGNGSAGFIDVVYDTNGDGVGTGEATIAANDPGNNAAGTAAVTTPTTLTVVEPGITVTKTVFAPSPAAGDPGDTITFEITLSNPAGANRSTAFDVVLTDTVPGSFENVAYVAGTLSSSGTVTGLPGAPTVVGNGVSLTLDSIAPGGSVTFRITATINDNGVSAPAPGSTITNTANVTATSLPGGSGSGGSWTGTAGTSSAVPGAAGSSTGERTGADGVGGALNDYAATASANATLNSHQIGGLLYHDANNNGSRDLGESLITVSTTFRLTGTDVAGNAVSVDVTTATGAYNFTGLRAGTYTITQLGQPTGYLDGRDTAGTSSPGAAFGGTGTLATDDRGTPATPIRDADAISSIVIVGGNQSKTGINYNFGEVLPASLGNLVFLDSNGNGRQDGGSEVGINGVSVTLNGTDDTGRAVTVNTTTAGGGLYQFTTLRPGSYTVTFGNSDGVTTYTRTVQDSAVATDTTDSDGNVATGTTGSYILASNDSNQSVDQGLYVPVSLGNRVFFDRDNDGVQDSGEPGIPGAGVQVVWLGPDGVFGGGDDQTFSTTTGADGIWSIGNLPPGSYRVTATAPGGVGWTLTDSFDNGILSATNPVTPSTTSGVNRTDIDFGYRGTASLGDRVYLDQDGDGVQDAGEQGLPGVTVTLRYDANNDGDYTDADDGLFTTVTNASGTYGFANLPAGNYQVSVGTPGSGGVPDNVSLTDSLDNGVLNPNASPLVSLTTGQNRTDADFGFRGTASIGDRVWYDADGNGVQGAGEPGIPGVTVTLLWSGPDGAFGGGDDVTFTTTTDANGNYLFPSLPVNGASDPYRVTVTRPASFPTQTYDATAPLTDDVSTLNLGPTENNVLQDFGYRGTATLGNLVWNDLDGNGRQDGSEPGINGVTVDLFYAGADGVFQPGELVTPLLTTTTAGGGLYQFPNLAAGTYRARFGASDGVTTYTRTVVDSAVATDATDSDANVSTGFTGDYTLANAASNQTVDQGLYVPVSLGNRVFFDFDNDGVQDSGEPGIPGAGIQVVWLGPDATFGGGDDQTFSTTTGADGIWSIGNLPPGSYRVTATAPGGAGWTLTDSIDNGGSPSATNPVTASTTSGVNRTDIDFGYRGTASLGDRVYLDQDGDGVQDAGEQGLPGVTVTLRYDANNDGDYTDADDGLFTTVTNASGTYGFANLPAGNYQVSVGTPGTGGVPDNVSLTDSLDNGVLSPTPSLAGPLATGQNRTDADFGFRGTASIGDRVWYDADGNGVQGAGEPGIPGVTVTLLWSGPDGAFGGGDDVTLTTTTDANGNYLFPSLPVNGVSDPYRVTVTRPASFPTQTYDATAPLTDDVSTLNLGPTENNVLQDFGYRGTATLGNLVWNDLDGNGRQDGSEPGINGVTVDLFYAGADGVFQPGELVTPLLTTTTAGGGLYQFPNLAAGTYRARFGASDGVTTYTRTVVDSAVATDATDSDANVSTGFTGDYTLANAGSNQTVDQGLYVPVSLGNRVFFDMDNDGVQDSGEPGIPGAGVQVIWLGPDGVFGGGDDQTFSTTTGADGIWSIGNLPPGSYRVTATAPGGAGWTLTDSIDNGGSPSATNPVTVSTTSGVNRTDVDFGFRGTGSIGDRIYIDQDADGVQDVGEPGLPGVTVTLRYDANNDGDVTDADDGLFTTVTDGSGNYSFANLPSGTYQVSVGVPGTGGVPDNVTLTDSIDNGVLNANSAPTVTLATGQNRTDVDFGFLGPVPASIGDRIWYDANGNGTQDAGEPGIPGVTVTLTWAGPNGAFGGGDDVTFTTTTDAAGDYIFVGLPVNGASGLYRVNVTRPAAFPTQTYDASGPVNDDSSTLTIGPAEINLLQDFGYRGTASLGDLVWNDLNGNGRFDGGEPGIDGVTVDLFYAGADGVFQPGEAVTPLLSTTTAGGGLYQFPNLAAGTYALRFGNTAGATNYTRTVLNSAVATDASDSDADVATGMTGSYVLANGSSNQTVDQGLYTPVSLGNRVFFDIDADGVQDANEPGIQNTSIQVVWLGPDGVFGGGDDQTFSTTTGADGIWSIGNLPPGSYRVTATPPGGLGWSISDSIDNGGAPSGTNPVTVSTTSGVNRTDIDFGFRGTGSIGDRIYFDENADGLQDVGEQGVPGITVTLVWGGFDGVLGNGDDITLTTVTDASGNYLFPNLPAGTYQVSVPSPGNGGVPGDVVLIDSLDNGILNPDAAPIVTLAAGQNRIDVDFAIGNPGLVMGADLGCDHGSLVRIVDPGSGAIRAERFAYEPSYRGGVRVYSADITGDGIPEILTAPGSGRAGEVRVFDRDLNPLPQFNFFPFGPKYRGGIEITAGSVTAPGVFEIVAAQSSGTSLVRVFRVNASSVTSTPIRQFQPFGKKFAGGVTVATANFGTYSGKTLTSPSVDGVSEIVVSSRAGMRAEVRVYNARPATPALINAFRVLGGSTRGSTVSRLPGANGAADRILVASGQRTGGQVETWARSGSAFNRVAAFAAFGGTTAAVSAAAINSENIFAVESVGGKTSGIRKHTAPSSSVSTEVPQSSSVSPAWRVAVVRR
jgi:fimbrial isopeptide formation D2 family protein